MFRKFLNFKFGQVQVEDLFKAIFILGLIPIILYGIIGVFSVNTGLIHLFSMANSSGVIFDPGLLISGISTLFLILIAIVMWKLICELLFLIFKSLEVFINRNR